MEERVPAAPSTFDNISSYLPDVKSYLGDQYTEEDLDGTLSEAATHPATTNDVISFEFIPPCFNEPQSSSSLLLLGYSHGFQVWDIKNEDSFKLLVSHKYDDDSSLSIKHATWASTSSILLGLSEEDDNDEERVAVSKISLSPLSTIFKLPLKDSISSIKANTTVFVVSTTTTSKLFVYSNIDDDTTCLHSFEIRDNDSATFDLGTRWVTYAAPDIPMRYPRSEIQDNLIPESLKRDNSAFNSNTNINSNTNTSSVSDVMQGVASGLYYLGKLTRKTIAEVQLYANDSEQYHQAVAAPTSTSTTAGSVLIRDSKTGKTLCHFISFPGNVEVSFLKFDPTGLLVLVSPSHGQTLHIHRLFPTRDYHYSSSDDGSNQRLLYKIVRGLTHARVINATFSLQSTYVAISTARGTTHLFDLEKKEGGGSEEKQKNTTEEENVIVPFSRSLSSMLEERRSSSFVKTLEALNRIRRTEGSSSVLAAKFINDRLLIGTAPSGILSQFKLTTVVLKSTNPTTSITDYISASLSPSPPPIPAKKTEESTSAVVLEETRRWNMKIRLDEKIVHALSYTKESTEEKPVMSSSSTLIDVCTHRQEIVPLWAHPKVSFCPLAPRSSSTLKRFSALELQNEGPLSVKRGGPVPLEPSLISQALASAHGQKTSPIYHRNNKSSSVSTDGSVPLDVLESNIHHAVGTPTEFGSWKEESVTTNNSTGGGGGVLKTSMLQDSYFNNTGNALKEVPLAKSPPPPSADTESQVLFEMD